MWRTVLYPAAYCLPLFVATISHAQVSWPTSLSPFTEQTTDALGISAEWLNVPESPVQFGRRNVLRFPIAATNQFFRLRVE